MIWLLRGHNFVSKREKRDKMFFAFQVERHFLRYSCAQYLSFTSAHVTKELNQGFWIYDICKDRTLFYAFETIVDWTKMFDFNI